MNKLKRFQPDLEILNWTEIENIVRINALLDNPYMSLSQLSEDPFLVYEIFSELNGNNIPKLVYQTMFNLPDEVIDKIEFNDPDFFWVSHDYYTGLLNDSLNDFLEGKLYGGLFGYGFSDSGSWGLMYYFDDTYDICDKFESLYNTTGG